MFFFIWQDNFLTNISEIDDQHRKLVALINNLYAALLKFEDSDQKRAFLIKTLEELIDYGCYHFDAEEQLMLKHEYPDYESHKAAHERFKLQVAQFLKEQRETTQVLPFPIVVFLKNWFTSHVLSTDLQYVPFIK